MNDVDASPAADVPFVSVVVPTHARPDLLARLLESLVIQEYPCDRYEVIVVHNVSDDDTRERVRGIAEKSRVSVSYYAKDYPGPMPSREFGARSARGEIIAFTDDDCAVTPRWLIEAVEAFGPGVGVIQGRTIPRPDQRRRLLEKTIDIPVATPFFETCNVFYRHEAFVQAGGFSQVFAEQRIFYGEDTDLAWKVKSLGYKTNFAPGAVVHHEVFPATFTEWLLEPRRFYLWPLLVRLHPGLRDYMFLKYFLTPRTALFDLMILGLILGCLVNWTVSVLAIPYVAYRLFEPARNRNPLLRIARLIAGVPRASVMFAALVYGSIRFRSVLI
jgi:GT2 family glycosyltransferase